MTDTNMALWNQVQKTDPSATKSAKVDGQNITAIGGQHMIKRATELFGPVGIGWGWNVLEERFDQGAPIYRETVVDANTKRMEQIGHEVGHAVRIRLWFILDGKKGEVEQYGCTPFTYKSKWGTTTDTEAPKKSLTDAIKKSLAMLGFSADIYLGLFDDREYVEQRREEEAIEKAVDQEAEAERQKQERLDWLKSAVEAMAKAVTLHELQALHTKCVREATRRSEAAFIKRLSRAFDERKAELEAKPNGETA